MNQKIVYTFLILAIAAPSSFTSAQSRQELVAAVSTENKLTSNAAFEKASVIAAAIPRVTTTVDVVADSPDALDGQTPVANITQIEILSSAGTFGDFTRYLQVLPGVVGSSDLSNDVLVRGGHSTENLFVVDGFEVPNINHFSLSGSNGGFTSMIDATAVGSMDLRDDAYDAGYASRLSSLIEIHTHELGAARQSGNLTAGISGAGGLYQRQLDRNGSLLLTAHRSIINLVTNDIGINGVPTYTNGMARLELHPSNQDTVTVFSLTGADTIDMTPCPSPGATSDYQTQYSGWRTTDAMNWRHNYSSQVTSNFIASYSLTRQQIDQQQQFGEFVDSNGNCHPISLLQTYNEDSRNGLSLLNYELSSSVRGWLISAGLRGSLVTPDDSVAQPNGQQSPFSADPSRSDAVTFKRNFTTGQTAGFVEADSGIGKRWKIMAGLRAESFAITGGYALDPRVSLTYKLNGRQSLNGSFNLSSQLPPMMDMISYASNNSLKPTEVRQEALGMRVWEAKWGTLDAQVYQKNYRREAVSTEYPQLMLSNMVDTLGQAFVWLPLTSAGTAQARGLELTLRAHRRDRMQWMVTASRSQATYRALDNLRRPENYDTPMAANAMGNIRLLKGFQLDLREAVSSGRVYTPFDLADSTVQDRGIYDLTQVNAQRGPLYNRLDMEVERTIKFSRGDLVIHAGADNVMNRGNLLGYVFLVNCHASWGCNAPVEKVDQMGRYPIFSARYEF
jgi:hypothetical protein